MKLVAQMLNNSTLVRMNCSKGVQQRLTWETSTELALQNFDIVPQTYSIPTNTKKSAALAKQTRHCS